MHMRTLERAVDAMLRGDGQRPLSPTGAGDELSYADARRMVISYFNSSGNARVQSYIANATLPLTRRMGIWLNAHEGHQRSPLFCPKVPCTERLDVLGPEVVTGAPDGVMGMRVCLTKCTAGSVDGKPDGSYNPAFMDFIVIMTPSSEVLASILQEYFPLPACIGRWPGPPA